MVFIYVGRKVKDKGIEELIGAFSKLSEQYSHAKLLFVGPYEKNDALKPTTIEKIKSLKQGGKIVDFDFEKDIRLFLKAADVLILPSYREGFPNVILQALAMETPCITTNISGCNEVIQDNINGYLINKQSVDELYVAMEKYMNNPQLIKKHKNYSRPIICDKFANDIVWHSLLEFYNKTLNHD
jgi:glycosyltransferase involved in cell wall biosynthesis